MAPHELQCASFNLPFVRQNPCPSGQPCRPTRYQNPFASRQALKVAIREDASPNRLELASDPIAISTGALGIGAPACWANIHMKRIEAPCVSANCAALVICLFLEPRRPARSNSLAEVSDALISACRTCELQIIDLAVSDIAA